MTAHTERVATSVREHADDPVWLLYYTLVYIRDLDTIGLYGQGRTALRTIAAEIAAIDEAKRATVVQAPAGPVSRGGAS